VWPCCATALLPSVGAGRPVYAIKARGTGDRT